MSTETSTETAEKNTQKKANKLQSAPKESATASYTAKDVDMNQYITVRNGYPGQLVYTSKRTGEKFFWEHYGDEQDIQLMELRNARNTSKKFFDHNWFVFDEEYDWVIGRFTTTLSIWKVLTHCLRKLRRRLKKNLPHSQMVKSVPLHTVLWK